MEKSVLRKYGDKLLFAIALAILAGGIIRVIPKTVKQEETTERPALVFSHWWEDALGQETIAELKREFESRNEGIVVAIENKPYEELRRELFSPAETNGPDETSNSAGTEERGRLADVFALDTLWLPELAERGRVETEAGKDSPAPLLSFVNALYYNTGILKRAGFSRPPKTRSEFLRYARAVSGTEGAPAALATDSGSFRYLADDVFPWILAAGAEVAGDRNPAPLAESLAFLAALRKEGLVFDAGPGNKTEAFAAGRAAFMISSSRETGTLESRMGEGAFGITSVPGPDNYAGKSFYTAESWAVGVNPASPLREEARLFSAFLAEKAPLLAEKTRAVPGTGAPQNVPYTRDDPFSAKLWDIVIAGESVRDFSLLPGTEFGAIFREELGALFSGEKSPAEAAAAIRKRQ